MVARKVWAGLMLFLAVGALTALGITKGMQGGAPLRWGVPHVRSVVPTRVTPTAESAAPRSIQPASVVLEEITRVRESLGGVVSEATFVELPAEAEVAVPARGDTTQFVETLRKLLGEESETEMFDSDDDPHCSTADPAAAHHPRESNSSVHPSGTGGAALILRSTARTIEAAAADLEDSGAFDDADRLRELVGRVRDEARRMSHDRFP